MIIKTNTDSLMVTMECVTMQLGVYPACKTHLEFVIRPVHEGIPNVDSDSPLLGVARCPLIPHGILSGGLTPWTHLQTCLPCTAISPHQQRTDLLEDALFHFPN